MATQDMLATLLGTVQDPGRKRELDDQMQNQNTSRMFAAASNPFQAMQASGAMGIQKSANNRDSVLQGGRRATNSGEFEVPALMKKAVQAVQERGISQARDPKAFFTAMAEETGKSPQLLPISMKFGEELSKINTAEENGRVKRAELGLKAKKQDSIDAKADRDAGNEEAADELRRVTIALREAQIKRQETQSLDDEEKTRQRRIEGNAPKAAKPSKVTKQDRRIVHGLWNRLRPENDLQIWDGLLEEDQELISTEIVLEAQKIVRESAARGEAVSMMSALQQAVAKYRLPGVNEEGDGESSSGIIGNTLSALAGTAKMTVSNIADELGYNSSIWERIPEIGSSEKPPGQDAGAVSPSADYTYDAKTGGLYPVGK
jgi:hypothetical protein